MNGLEAYGTSKEVNGEKFQIHVEIPMTEIKQITKVTDFCTFIVKRELN